VAAIDKGVVVGRWQRKREIVIIQSDGEFTAKGPGKKLTSGTWIIKGDSLEFRSGGATRKFQMRKHLRSIYETASNERRAGMRSDYLRQK